MKKFEDYLSFEEFETIMKSEKNDEDLIPLHEALDKFLVDNQLVKPFTNHQTHRTNFGFYWQNYCEGKAEDYQKERVLDGIINKYLFMRIFYEEDIKKAYENLNNKINQGNFQPFDLMDSLYDFESGEDFKLVLKNWVPSLVKFIPGATLQDRARFELAKEEPIQKVIEAQIEFKTGHLIVADWFKIDEFTQLVDKDNNFSVNSEKGRIEQAQYYLEKFNFIHTSAWNSSDLYQKDNTFIFVSFDEDFEAPKGYKDMGHVDKELRALSIIEKEHLISLVGSEEKVNQYLKEYSGDIIELNVEPGIYNFTLSSAPELIKKEMPKLNTWQSTEHQDDIEKLLKNKHFNPILIMQGLELEPKKQLKMKV